jgi:hypothetical protein
VVTRTEIRNGRIGFALLGIALISFLAFSAQARAGIGDGPALPSISSDKADYAPGELVTLSGANWAAGESVHVVVNDDAGQTWRYENDATAADNGSFSLQFNLPDWFVATYAVTASGSSGTAATSFTDANLKFALATADNAAPSTVSWSVNWDQWQGTGQNANNTCANLRSAFGTANYTGNTLSSGSEAGINNNASAKPTSAQTTGAFAGQYVLDYWSSSPTSNTALNATELCQGGVNGPTVFTFYAHFELADSTAPTTIATPSPAANGDGWNNTNVSVSLSGTDDAGGSGVKEITYFATGAQTIASTTVSGSSVSGINIAAEGETTLSFFAEDNAGNVEATKTQVVRIDKTKPVISGSRTPAANVDGWNNTNVVVSFSCAEAGAVQSGIKTDTVAGDTVSTAGENQSVTNTGACVDKAGNPADPATVGGISIDKTDPGIAFNSRTPAANANGWNNTDVTVVWDCSDELSGPKQASVSDTKSAEGADQTASATCFDKAGNSKGASLEGISIDKTKPTLNPSVSPNPVLLNGSATASPNASDDLSGVASASCDPVDTSSVGPKSVACTATDKAGNEKTASANYSVVYSTTGFLQPVDNKILNGMKAGSTAPMKWQLKDANGNYVSSLSAVVKAASGVMACDAGLPVDNLEEYATGGTALRYDSASNQYVYNWQSPRQAGKCYKVVITLLDGTVLSANFQLK